MENYSNLSQLAQFLELQTPIPTQFPTPARTPSTTADSHGVMATPMSATAHHPMDYRFSSTTIPPSTVFPLYSPSQVPSVLSSTPPTIAAVAAAAAASRQNLLAAYGIGSSTPQLSVPVTAQMWQGHTALTQGQTVASHSLGNYLYHFSPAAHSSQNELGRRQQGQQLQQQALNQEMLIRSVHNQYTPGHEAGLTLAPDRLSSSYVVAIPQQQQQEQKQRPLLNIADTSTRDMTSLSSMLFPSSMAMTMAPTNSVTSTAAPPATATAATAAVDPPNASLLASELLSTITSSAGGTRSQANVEGPDRTSQYRGVTYHRRSRRWEAHGWSQILKKQIYLGGFRSEEKAAEAHDMFALKTKDDRAVTNFPRNSWPSQLLRYLSAITVDNLIKALRSRCTGFTRGGSKYRGVIRNVNEEWEAWLSSPRRSYLIGTFNNEDDAAQAFDRELVLLEGRQAFTNFGIGNYTRELEQRENESPGSILLRGPRY